MELKRKFIIVVISILLIIVFIPTMVEGSFLSWLFGEEDDTAKSQIIEQIKEEISDLERIDGSESLYDFQVEKVLNKYGTINYTFWTNSIKSITTKDGDKIPIKDIYSGKIIKSTAEQQYAGGIYDVAEGIETRQQVDFLCSLGCDLIQGYYFAKPMPIEEFEEKYKEK